MTKVQEMMIDKLQSDVALLKNTLEKVKAECSATLNTLADVEKVFGNETPKDEEEFNKRLVDLLMSIVIPPEFRDEEDKDEIPQHN